MAIVKLRLLNNFTYLLTYLQSLSYYMGTLNLLSLLLLVLISFVESMIMLCTVEQTLSCA